MHMHARSMRACRIHACMPLCLYMRVCILVCTHIRIWEYRQLIIGAIFNTVESGLSCRSLLHSAKFHHRRLCRAVNCIFMEESPPNMQNASRKSVSVNLKNYNLVDIVKFQGLSVYHCINCWDTHPHTHTHTYVYTFACMNYTQIYVFVKNMYTVWGKTRKEAR